MSKQTLSVISFLQQPCYPRFQGVETGSERLRNLTKHTQLWTLALNTA